MQVKYDNYYFTDTDPQQRIPDTRALPYYPPEPEPDYGDDSYKFPSQPGYYIVRDTKKKPVKKPVKKPPEDRVNEKDLDKESAKQESKSNEKLYIGLLLGSVGLFLITLYYFLFIANKKNKRIR